jgi:hypothetical protein
MNPAYNKRECSQGAMVISPGSFNCSFFTQQVCDFIVAFQNYPVNWSLSMIILYIDILAVWDE